VSLYWFENLVIRAFNVLKMLTATGDMPIGSQTVGDPGEHPEMPAYLRKAVHIGTMSHGIKLFLIPFFTVHHGMFYLAHGIFFVVLLGGQRGGIMTGNPLSRVDPIVRRIFDSGGK
jgi:hypothetical protein